LNTKFILIPTRSASSRRWWLLALVLLFAVTTFRFQHIPDTYMREDEEIAFRTTAHSLESAIRYQAEHDVQAPIWFASFWLWQQYAGSSEYAGRVYSILLSALTLALVYQVGRRWFGAPRYGLFVMAAVGVNAYATIFSLEIRPYALIMLVTTINMLLFYRWLRHETRRTALLYGVSIALLLWIHYLSAFVVAGQVIYLLLTGRLFQKRILKQDFVAAVTALVLWLPWLPVFISQLAALRHVETASGDYRGLGIGSTAELTTPETILRLVNVATNGLPLLYGLVLIAGLMLLWRHAGYRIALVWALLIPAINLIVNLAAAVYTQRYISFISLGVAIAMGAALAALPARARWQALVGFAALSLWALPSQLPFHVPHRAIFQAMSDIAESGDVVVFEQADEGDNLVRWQIDHYLAPDLRAAEIDSPSDAENARGIWLVTQRLFEPDVQTAFNRLEVTHPLQTVIGSCNPEWCYVAQRLQGPPEEESILFGDKMAFWGADIDLVTPTRIDVRLWWRVEAAPDTNLSISVQVLNEQGQLVAQNDGTINHYGTLVETSQLEPNKIYIDSRSILPVQPLPDGAYHLSLVVYQSWDGMRLTLPDGSDTLELGTITLP
jgi:4-amino-4-deoxy-L-arabinose transferase-like glycosyltransferase